MKRSMAKEGRNKLQQDLITSISKKIEFFVTKHLKIILVSIISLAVLLSAYFSIDRIIFKSEDRANIAFGKVYLSYLDLINGKTLEQKEFNTKLLQLNEEFKVVIEDFPTSKAASKSAYFIGNIQFKLGNYREAIEYFKRGYSSNPKGYFSFLSLQGEASSYEQLSELQKAEKAYKEVLDNFKDNFIIPIIKFNLGLIYEKQNKLEKALEEYNQIVSDFEWSSWKDLAEKRILLLKNFI